MRSWLSEIVDLPGLEIGFAQRHAVEVDVDSALGAGHLRQRRREAGRAEILQRLDEAAFRQLDADLDQLLASERISDLNRGPLVLVLLAELLAGQHAGAPNPVASGSRPVQGYEVSDAAGGGAREPFPRKESDAHRIDEAVVFIGNIEHRITADGWHADTVAIVGNTLDRPLELPAGMAEAEAVQECDRPGAHGRDVTEDPAHAGCRSLERLDRGGVVVALDLERHRLAVAQVDDPGVLARPLEDSFAVGRKAAQEEGRVLVRAVLRPEQREHRELEVVRVAPEQFADSLEFPVGEAEGAVKRLFCDPRQSIRV